jgi:hypothetical protein
MKFVLSLYREFFVAVVFMTTGALWGCVGESTLPMDQELLVIGTEYAFAAPSQIASGIVTIRFVNAGSTELHNAALIRLTGGNSLQEFADYMRDGLQAPDWAVHVGGVESIPPGTEAQAKVILKPGPHLLVCYHGEGQGVPHHALGMIASLDVVGSSSDDPEPEFDIDLVMFDFGYALSDSLKVGQQTIRVIGGGPQVHNVLIWKLREGKTATELVQWLESDRTTPRPGRPLGGLTALSPGERAYLPIELEAGRYVLLCLVPDVGDGRFHLSHGMMKEVQIR